MRLSHLHQSDVTPGQISAWVPTASTFCALSSCPPDDRPLAHDQLQHLTRTHDVPRAEPVSLAGSELEAAPWIGLSCRLEGATPRSVAATLSSLFDRHESLRCDYVRSQREVRDGIPDEARTGTGRRGEPFARRLLPAEAVDFEEVPLGLATTSEQAHAIVNGHLGRHAQGAAWPFSAFVTVESEHEVRLFAAFDHVSFDGYSLYRAAEEIPLLHRAFATRDAPDRALGLPGSHLDHARDEREFTSRLTAHDPRLTAWRELLDDDGRVPGLPSASGVARGEQWSHDLVTLPVSTLQEARAFHEVCRSWGLSTGLAHISLLLGAIAAREGAGPSTVRSMMSVHGRGADQMGALGWFAGVAPLTVDIDGSADLRSVTDTVARAWATSAPSGAIPLPMVGHLLETPIEPALVLSYIDASRGPGWKEWQAAQARGFLGAVPPSDQMHAWITCLPTGTFLEARHPATPQCANWVAGLATSMRAGLQSALASRPLDLVSANSTSGERPSCR